MMETPIDRYIKSYIGSDPRDGVTRDVTFNRKSFGPDQPENPDQGHLYVGTDGINISLVQDYDDETFQRVCTYAINATRGIDPLNPPDPVDWEELLQGGLQTALEDFRVAFAHTGVSRTATHQIVRTRRAAFHQQSQRAHYYGNNPSVRMPESFVGVKGINPDFPEKALLDVEEEYQELVEHAAWFYQMATDAGISYQDARFGLLEGTVNFILWEGSLREFIDTYAYRACSMFQWEIVYCFREMRRLLVEAHPYLDKYIKISCERTHGSLDKIVDISSTGLPEEAYAHACTFQGWEHVEGQCDFPWARENNRTFKSKHHEIANKNA